MKDFFQLREELSHITEATDRATHYQNLAKTHRDNEAEHRDHFIDHDQAYQDHNDKATGRIKRDGPVHDPVKAFHRKGKELHNNAIDAHDNAGSYHSDAQNAAEAAAAAHKKHGPDHPKTKAAEKDYNFKSSVAKGVTRNARIASAKANQHDSKKPTNESTLDEISDKAVDNYRKAAIKSFNKSANYFANQGYEPNPKSVAKHRENQRRRDRGIGSAYKRDLAKSSGQKYIHKPTYTRGLVGGKKDDAPQLTSKRADQLHKRYKDR